MKRLISGCQSAARSRVKTIEERDQLTVAALFTSLFASVSSQQPLNSCLRFTKIRWRSPACFGLVEHDYEQVCNRLGHLRQLTRSVLIHEMQHRELLGRLMDNLLCFGMMCSCHASPLYQVLSWKCRPVAAGRCAFMRLAKAAD